MGLLIQGSALLALFVIMVIGAGESWMVVTMLLLFAAICFSRAVKERRAEAQAERRRVARRSASSGLS
ncbi:hypothetical protein C1C97_007105 [Kocuria tytonis]|uniref:Uncharacterized protein n=1 Tax=Kocuria tytonis TaxID=2054280 RepID=A0A495A951_9MICC|nr:hypothetical protein C1C97_007105 [Kocuria tytonis]